MRSPALIQFVVIFWVWDSFPCNTARNPSQSLIFSDNVEQAVINCAPSVSAICARQLFWAISPNGLKMVWPFIPRYNESENAMLDNIQVTQKFKKVGSRRTRREQRTYIRITGRPIWPPTIWRERNTTWLRLKSAPSRSNIFTKVSAERERLSEKLTDKPSLWHWVTSSFNRNCTIAWSSGVLKKHKRQSPWAWTYFVVQAQWGALQLLFIVLKYSQVALQAGDNDVVIFMYWGPIEKARAPVWW